ncbi:phosphoenolpyruvate mutase [SAR202 cluster bacterium AD-493-K16_JPT_193m]|nr:phosphoenolpyruvate mutase [SAR202 cluster bacterium AD-493-K16_JPT_193m]
MSAKGQITPSERIRSLITSIEQKGFIRLMEAHSGLSGIVAENATGILDEESVVFDGIWESSLTDSATKGFPDASIIGIESRLHTINEILNVTSIPLVVDGDTGGEPAQFQYIVKNLERMGVSAVIIEDKVFPKRNSLDNSASQALENPDTFAAKIAYGKQVALTKEFMVISRIESLIAGTGLEDALSRAVKYIEAGVDGVMIHSNQRDPNDLFQFVKEYELICKAAGRRPILVSVPTTYNQYSDTDLVGLGFDIIIHANQLLRASYKAMQDAAKNILETGSSFSVDAQIAPVKEVASAVGFDEILDLDRERNLSLQIPTIIPAAGYDDSFPEGPKSLISVAGKNVLDYQLEAIRKSGLKQVIVVRGNGGEQFDEFYRSAPNIDLIDNKSYMEHHSLHSLITARDSMQDGFLLVYSDILFDSGIIDRLIGTKEDIVLGLDNSYTYHKHDIDKRLDLVVSSKSYEPRYRSLKPDSVNKVVQVGKDIELDKADYEFIGIAYFSSAGARALLEVYDESIGKSSGKFHESLSIQRAAVTDLLQEMINTGYEIHGLETLKGWMEIHTPEDVRIAENEIATISTR